MLLYTPLEMFKWQSSHRDICGNTRGRHSMAGPHLEKVIQPGFRRIKTTYKQALFKMPDKCARKFWNQESSRQGISSGPVPWSYKQY